MYLINLLKGVRVSISEDFNDVNQALFARRILLNKTIEELEVKLHGKSIKPIVVKAPRGRKPKNGRPVEPPAPIIVKEHKKMNQAERALQIEIDIEKRNLDIVNSEIIQANYGLVLNYVRRFTNNTTREDSKDFEGAGVLGLMRAIDTYDPTRGSKFSTWAYKPIQRECLKAVRDADFQQLNPGDFEKRPDILRAVRELKNDEDDAPMPDYAAVAKLANTTTEAVRRVLDSHSLESLSKPIGDEGSTYLSDMIADSDMAVDDQVISTQELTDLEKFGLGALDERELFVISRRFGLDAEPSQRLSAIGNILGLSREAVRQVEAKALSKLNHPVVRRKLMRHGRD